MLALVSVCVCVFGVCVQWKPNNHGYRIEKEQPSTSVRLLFSQQPPGGSLGTTSLTFSFLFLFVLNLLLRRFEKRVREIGPVWKNHIQQRWRSRRLLTFTFFYSACFEIVSVLECSPRKRGFLVFNLLKNYQVVSLALHSHRNDVHLFWFFVCCCCCCCLICVQVEPDSTLDREKVPIRGSDRGGHALRSTSLRRLAPAFFCF